MSDAPTKPPDAPEDPATASGAAGEKAGFVPELVRRAIVAGVGAIFMTEEGLRGMVGDLKLPKEAAGYLRDQAEKTRSEISRVASRELRRFFESDKLKTEALKLLSSMSIEVKATIRLKPTGEPTVKPQVKVHLSDREAPEPPESE